MRNRLSTLFLIILVSGISFPVFAQSQDSVRLSALKTKLEEMSSTHALYNEKIDLTIHNMPISQLLKNIAKASGLNMNVNFDDGKRITCNFKQIPIKDLIYFICKEHSFEVDILGNILSVYPYKTPPQEPTLLVNFQQAGQTLSFDFSGVQLIHVIRKIAETSGINLIAPQQLFGYRITAYGNEMKIDDAIQSIAAANSLIAQKKNETTWTVQQENMGSQHPGAGIRSAFFHANNLQVDSLGFITARLNQANIQQLIQDICQRLSINYFFTDPLEESTGISVENADLDSFLKVLFTGTNYTWREENGIYIFGRKQEGNSLSAVRVFAMKYRTVDKVTDLIPAELKKEMEIITFPDLNSLILHGDQRNVMQIVSFLNKIDKSVPLISIDVIILDATDTTTQEAGITMGLGEKPAGTSGSLSPGVDFSLGAHSINKLIHSFNGFGSINLGKVTPNFYLGLKLLEEDGKVVLRSTPRLSTLNGHKAVLKSGEMKYYKESQINIIGSQNPMQSESYQWKNVEANMSLDITPYVSLDSCITLQIELTQSEFTEREVKDAPPGTTTRSFNSIIRVKNQEMVLLGGIERNMSSHTSKGLPFISRIPVLRSIFGSTSKRKSLQKLNVFIKPTIIE